MTRDEDAEMKCAVKDCTNHSHQGKFVGLLCSPCHAFIAGDRGGEYSQAYRNARHGIDEAVKAENEALRRDAERYRWLRKESGKNPDFYSGETRWMVSRAQGGRGQNLFGDKIDFAIDTEMQRAEADRLRAEADRLREVITKLVGAIDMIREALNGSNVEDLLVIVNSALSAALEVKT